MTHAIPRSTLSYPSEPILPDPSLPKHYPTLPRILSYSILSYTISHVPRQKVVEASGNRRKRSTLRLFPRHNQRRDSLLVSQGTNLHAVLAINKA